MTNEALSAARLSEILATTEGVTPGPWRRHVPDQGYCDDYIVTDHPDHKPFGEYRFRNVVAETGVQHEPPGAKQRFATDAKYLANCDPQTVSALVSELIDKREAVDRLTRERDEARAHHEYFAIESDGRRYAIEAAEAQLAKMREALEAPAVWSDEERDGMLTAFQAAHARHGIYEALFAVATWLLRHRAGAHHAPD